MCWTAICNSCGLQACYYDNWRMCPGHNLGLSFSMDETVGEVYTEYNPRPYMVKWCCWPVARVDAPLI